MAQPWNLNFAPILGTVTTAGTTIIGKAPSDAVAGGITINAGGYTIPAGTAAAGFRVLDMGSDGATLTGTVMTLGNGTVFAGGSICSVTDYWLDGGNYLGLQVTAGTIAAGIAALWLNGFVGK